MLRLFYHPLASFCHKVLMALYENGTPFERELVDLMDAESRARYLDRWPIGKMPILFDEESGRTIPESSIIIEYLDQHYPGANPLLPEGDSQRLDVRLWDRFFDLYVQTPMQKIVGDRLRSDNEHDPRGVTDAKASLQAAYDMIERRALHHGRLCGVPGAFLCGHRRAVRKHASEHRGLLRSVGGTRVIQASDRGGAPLPRTVSFQGIRPAALSLADTKVSTDTFG
jgi:glutathione S-transferase